MLSAFDNKFSHATKFSQVVKTWTQAMKNESAGGLHKKKLAASDPCLPKNAGTVLEKGYTPAKGKY
jgi:hypothetical protein